MHFTAIFPFALLPAVVIATGQAVVYNECSFPSYLWSADPSGTGPGNTLEATDGFYSETYRGKGISLKLSGSSSESSLYDPNNPLTQFQYTLDGSTVYYALADMNGDLYAGHKVVLQPSDSSCPTITWSSGTGPSAVYTCGQNANLTLTLCA